jgi:hypothetical protein
MKDLFSIEQMAEESVKEIMLDIVKILHKHGIEDPSVGAVMRLVGIPTNVAELWERYYLSLDENGKLGVSMKLSEDSDEKPIFSPSLLEKYSKKTIH